MPEVVQPANAGRVQDELVDKLLERTLDRVGRHVHDPGEDIRHEAAAEYRPGPGHGTGVVAESAHASKDRILDRQGDRRVTNRPTVAGIASEGGQQLLDVERDPVGAVVDGGVEIQGDLRDRAREVLVKKGWTVKG